MFVNWTMWQYKQPTKQFIRWKSYEHACMPYKPTVVIQPKKSDSFTFQPCFLDNLLKQISSTFVFVYACLSLSFPYLYSIASLEMRKQTSSFIPVFKFLGEGYRHTWNITSKWWACTLVHRYHIVWRISRWKKIVGRKYVIVLELFFCILIQIWHCCCRCR